MVPDGSKRLAPVVQLVDLVEARNGVLTHIGLRRSFRGSPATDGCKPRADRHYASRMESLGREESIASLVDAADRRYVESLVPGGERAKVIASLARYRAAEVLQAGDPLPDVTLRRGEDLESIAVAELVRGRPLLLVFGSFT